MHHDTHWKIRAGARIAGKARYPRTEAGVSVVAVALDQPVGRRTEAEKAEAAADVGREPLSPGQSGDSGGLAERPAENGRHGEPLSV